MRKKPNICILGATGAVGTEMLKVLQEIYNWMMITEIYMSTEI